MSGPHLGCWSPQLEYSVRSGPHLGWLSSFSFRLGGVGFAPSNEDLTSGRRLALDEPVSADHVQSEARPRLLFGTPFWPLDFGTIVVPFRAGKLHQATAFYHLLDDLAA